MTATNNNRPLTYTQLDSQPAKPQFGWVKKLLYLAIASLLIAVLLKTLTPTQVEEQTIIQKNFNNTVSSFNNIMYTGEVVLIPNNLPTAAIKSIQLDDVQMREAIISQFSLTTDLAPEKDTTFPQTYSNQDFEMYQIPEGKQYQVVGKNPPADGVVSLDTALPAAQKIVDQLYPDAKLKPTTSKIILGSSAAGEVVATAPNTADLVLIPFSPQVGDFPVYDNQSLNPVVLVWLDSNNQLQKLTAQTQYLSITKGRSYKTLTYTQALRNINDDQASIASGIYLDPGEISYDSIIAGTLINAVVEYHSDPTTGQAVPYYHFSGKLIDLQNKTFQADILTPAIQTKFSN